LSRRKGLEKKKWFVVREKRIEGMGREEHTTGRWEEDLVVLKLQEKRNYQRVIRSCIQRGNEAMRP
jgi:hypothetical protein